MKKEVTESFSVYITVLSAKGLKSKRQGQSLSLSPLSLSENLKRIFLRRKKFKLKYVYIYLYEYFLINLLFMQENVNSL